MKRDFLYASILFILIAFAVGASCMGCGSPSANVDNQNEASVDIGNVDTGDVNVGSQETTVVVGNECDHGVNWPLWGTVWGWSAVILYLIYSGNLHPTKKPHGKGGENNENGGKD